MKKMSQWSEWLDFFLPFLLGQLSTLVMIWLCNNLDEDDE